MYDSQGAPDNSYTGAIIFLGGLNAFFMNSKR